MKLARIGLPCALVLLTLTTGCVGTPPADQDGPSIDPRLFAMMLREVDAIIDQKLDIGEVLSRTELQMIVQEVVEAQLVGTPYEGQGYGELVVAIIDVVGGRLVREGE